MMRERERESLALWMILNQKDRQTVRASFATFTDVKYNDYVRD